MLNQISWGDYFKTLAIILGIYYTIIVLIYFRRDIVNIVLNRKLKVLSSPASNKKSTEDEALADADFNQVKLLIEDINLIFERGYIREELIHALQVKVKDYKHIQGTAYQVAVMNYILKTAQEKSSIQVSESDMRVIWNET